MKVAHYNVSKMGLDIYTDNCSERVGSYSGVHHLRKEMIIASIKYLEQFKDCCSSINMIKVLKESLVADNMDIINYDKFKNFKDIADHYMMGLYKWVYHSDCEGMLSSYDSEMILETLKHIYPFIDSRYFTGDIIELEEFYLYDIFKDSIDNDCDIVFG